MGFGPVSVGLGKSIYGNNDWAKRRRATIRICYINGYLVIVCKTIAAKCIGSTVLYTYTILL